MEELVLGFKRIFEGPWSLMSYVGEEVEVNVGDFSIYGVIDGVDGVWVKLRGKNYKEEEYMYLIPIFSIRFVRRVKPVSSQGTP
jgi:hypothetical protein